MNAVALPNMVSRTFTFILGFAVFLAVWQVAVEASGTHLTSYLLLSTSVVSLLKIMQIWRIMLMLQRLKLS